MNLVKKKEELYIGPETDEFYKWEIIVDGQAFLFVPSDLQLLTENDVSEEILDKLFADNKISTNSYKGYDSAEGVSLYYKYIDHLLFIFSRGEKQPGLFILYIEAVFHGRSSETTDREISKPTSYKRFKLASDPKIIGGSYPQIDNFISAVKLSRNEKKIFTKYYSDFIPKEIELNSFKINSRGILTDFCSSTFLSLNGFFISSKVYSILKNIEMSNVMYFASTVYQKNHSNAGFYMNIKEANIINYKRSNFLIKENESSAGGVDIRFADNTEHDSKIDELIDSGSDNDVFASKIRLSSQPHLFKLYATNQYYISDSLELEFEAHNLTGYITEKQDLFNN